MREPNFLRVWGMESANHIPEEEVLMSQLSTVRI